MRAEDDPLYVQIIRYENLPPDPKFSIETSDNTELGTYAQADLKQALERHGVSYGRSAHLVIALTVAKVSGNRPPTASFDTRTGQLHIAIDPAQPSNFPQLAYQYRISLDLFDQQSGSYLWRGQVTDEQQQADAFVTTSRMIDRLVDLLVSARISDKCPINQNCLILER